MLDDLTAGALEDAENRRTERPLQVVEADAGKRPGARDVLAALAPADHVKIVAEVKRASPSKGHLAEIPDPAALAVAFEAGGASAISVLTEGRRFRGSLADLEAVREAVSLPVLRKDFIASPYQVFEARAAGADFLLLIVSALSQDHLASLFKLTEELGMTALVEVHDADQVGRALDVGAQLIGVNGRDLTTFEVDQELFGRLADRIPAGVIRVAESGVTSPADVVRYSDAGADVVLVGEALVTGDPIATLQRFLAV